MKHKLPLSIILSFFFITVIEAGGTHTDHASKPHSSHQQTLPKHQHASSHEHKPIFAAGVIQSINNKKLVLIHEPIPVLGWPKMKMDFIVSDSIDLSKFKRGERIHFELISTGKKSEYMIQSIHPWVHNVEDHN